MLRWKAWRRQLSLATLLFGLLQGLSFAQCEMCKTGLTSSPEGARLIDGFRTGILFLMLAPYMLVGTVALIMFVAYRRRSA